MSGTTFLAGGYFLHGRHEIGERKLLPDLSFWRTGALIPEVHASPETLLDNRYQAGEVLAQGGFATVLSGFDRAQDRRCAIKIFLSEVSDKAWINRGFEHEIAALQQIHHPNVVSIYAHGVTASGGPYLVMEFIDGKSLREILANGPLPRRRSAEFIRQLAGALDAIHRGNICHRDVKPENIMIRNEGAADEEAILIDFSIAMVKDANETLHGLSRAAGTFDYMPPEQTVGHAGPSSDIYSFAKLIIEMLTGRRVSSLLPNAGLDLPARAGDLLKNFYVGFSAESIAMLTTALEFDPRKRPNAAILFAAPIITDLESRN